MTLLAAWRELGEVERTARLRTLRALVRVLGAGAGVEVAIADAERNVSLLPAADAALDRLPSITLRRVLSVFAATLPQASADRLTPTEMRADSQASYLATCEAMRPRAWRPKGCKP